MAHPTPMTGQKTFGNSAAGSKIGQKVWRDIGCQTNHFDWRRLLTLKGASRVAAPHGGPSPGGRPTLPRGTKLVE